MHRLDDGYYNVRFDGEQHSSKVWVWFKYATNEIKPTWGWDAEDDPEALPDSALIDIDGVWVAANEWWKESRLRTWYFVEYLEDNAWCPLGVFLTYDSAFTEVNDGAEYRIIKQVREVVWLSNAN